MIGAIPPFAELARRPVHAWRGGALTAARYMRHKRDNPHMSAANALRWAKSEARDDAWRMWREDMGEGRLSERWRDEICAYANTSQGGRVRLEWSVVADDMRDDETDESDAAELFAYFRKSKLGRTQAREAAARSLASRAEYERKRERGDYSSVGVVARVYFDGAEVAEASCWGYESEACDTEDFEREVCGEALHDAFKAIRQIERERRSWAREFGFCLPLNTKD